MAFETMTLDAMNVNTRGRVSKQYGSDAFAAIHETMEACGTLIYKGGWGFFVQSDSRKGVPVVLSFCSSRAVQSQLPQAQGSAPFWSRQLRRSQQLNQINISSCGTGRRDSRLLPFLRLRLPSRNSMPAVTP